MSCLPECLVSSGIVIAIRFGVYTVHWYKCVLSFASSYIYFKEQYIVRVLLNTVNKTLSIYGEYIILVCTWYMSKEVLRGCKFACVWGNWWIWIYEKFFFIFFVFVFLLSFFPSFFIYILFFYHFLKFFCLNLSAQ